MKPMIESVFIDLEEADLDEFIEITQKVGYKYLILCTPNYEDEIHAAWACYDDAELIELCLMLAGTHLVEVSQLNSSSQFSLN